MPLLIFCAAAGLGFAVSAAARISAHRHPATLVDRPEINRIHNQPSVRRFTLGLPFESLRSSPRVLEGDAQLRTCLVACGADARG
ncbi:MAG TPA: hypothetical protein VMH92_11040 [Acidocella sp.]|nr:hypothetical protein [Acidocella sp.]